MSFISKIFELSDIELPSFACDQCYMEKVDIGFPSLGASLHRWEETLKTALRMCPAKNGEAYLTIDQKVIEEGKTHRRGGPHTDGNYLYGWGGEGGGWLTGENGRILTSDKHKAQYCSSGGGMLIASTVEGCRGWVGEFDDPPRQGGNCNHINLSTMQEVALKPNTLYLANSTFIHESMPMKTRVKRSLFRVTLPHDVLI